MASKLKKTTKASDRTGLRFPNSKTGKAPRTKAAGSLAALLPKITTTEQVWPRMLRMLDHAVMVHVQGYTPGPRPRTTDPGWEDLIELQTAVAREVEILATP